MHRRAAIAALSALLAVPSAGRAGSGMRTVQSDSRWARNDPASSLVVDHAAWGRLLTRHVRASPDGINRFAYAAVTAEERQALEGYVQGLSRVAVSKLAPPAQLAFWANLHNALAVCLVLDRYPTTSIRDIGVTTSPPADGPWAADLVSVEDQPLSLDAIANGILRPLWHDARINYVICCATLGSPNLGHAPLEPAMLDRQLDAAAIAFVNHPRGVSLPNGRLRVSSIYVWHEHDFGSGQRAVIKHLMAYAAPPLALLLRGRTAIDEDAYDWRLNGVSDDS